MDVEFCQYFHFIEIIIYFYFLQFCCRIRLIDFMDIEEILTPDSLIWSWCMIFNALLLIARISLRIFASMFIRDTGLQFPRALLPVSGSALGRWYPSQNESKFHLPWLPRRAREDRRWPSRNFQGNSMRNTWPGLIHGKTSDRHITHAFFRISVKISHFFLIHF